MNELFPDWKVLGAPLHQPDTGDEVLFQDAKQSRKTPGWRRPKQTCHFVAFQPKSMRKVLIHEGIFTPISGTDELAASTRLEASNRLQLLTPTPN